LCCFSTSVYYCCCLFRYRLSPDTFGYTLVYDLGLHEHYDRGFEIRAMHGYVSEFFCVVLSCEGRGLAMGRSLI